MKYTLIALCGAMLFVVALGLAVSALAQSSDGSITAITPHQITVQCSAAMSFAVGSDIDVTYAGGMMTFLIGRCRVASVSSNSLVLDILSLTTPPSHGMKVQLEAGSEVVNDLFSPDYQQQKTVDVAAIQRLLDALGYKPGPPNGIVDKQTETAICRFQRESQQPVDGKATHELYRLLMAEQQSFDRYNKKNNASVTAPSVADPGPDTGRQSDFGNAFDSF